MNKIERGQVFLWVWAAYWTGSFLADWGEEYGGDIETLSWDDIPWLIGFILIPILFYWLGKTDQND